MTAARPYLIGILIGLITCQLIHTYLSLLTRLTAIEHFISSIVSIHS